MRPSHRCYRDAGKHVAAEGLVVLCVRVRMRKRIAPGPRHCQPCALQTVQGVYILTPVLTGRTDDIYRDDITFRDPRNSFTGKRCWASALVGRKGFCLVTLFCGLCG